MPRGKQGKRQGKEFMDAALDAYIRHLALEKWREVTDLQEALGPEPLQALRAAGDFAPRGPYRAIWERWWQAQVVEGEASAPLLGRIEAAVRGALHEERQARRQCGDVALEDTRDYKAFLDQALGQLFAEEAGAIEEL
ncbi:MAG: hypothetical protein KatS3mg131_0553 [Candidatus Tectimicrobiota bacterium]|nr:MAG: hypothetical protein KatS3mg131_0553 [Candidatus Tectomicrobia bacterium]